MFGALVKHRNIVIAIGATVGIATALLLKLTMPSGSEWPSHALRGVILLGGVPLIAELAANLFHGVFGSDLLAGISIAVSWMLGENLAGAIVVLMLSGGQALESFAVRQASDVLRALAKRMPAQARRQTEQGPVSISISDIRIGDLLVVAPHEVCPVDGIVREGHGSMDEAYLTGEPFEISKSVGSEVISGALNGGTTLVIEATKPAIDSRYARISEVMREASQQKPQMRRLADQLGAWYTPLALVVAGLAWAFTADPRRFLSVLVTATPCPLLIAIPVAMIGAISLAARRGIIVRDPAVLENIGQCRTLLFDKTGTLTYGQPMLVQQVPLGEWSSRKVLQLAASIEQYSRHPLAQPILDAAKIAGVAQRAADQVEEKPGEGLLGTVENKQVRITSRSALEKKAAARNEAAPTLPVGGGGLECVVLVNEALAALYRFRDTPRSEGADFVRHLGPNHQFSRLLLVSGDRESEVRYLADAVGISEIHASATPEEKVEIVRRETKLAKTLFLGDGVNDAPALMAASVGVAMGQAHEVTTQAAGAVIMSNSLTSVDELIHIGRKMRRIALQSALGGMAASLGGMTFAAAGMLSPVWGALLQEVIDVAAVLNALRAARWNGPLHDFSANHQTRSTQGGRSAADTAS